MKPRILGLLLSLLLIFSAGFGSTFPVSTTLATENLPLPKSFQQVESKSPSFTRSVSFEWSVGQIMWSISEEGITANMEGHQQLYVPGKPVVPYQVFHYELAPNQEIAYVKTTHLVSYPSPISNSPVQLAKEPLIFTQPDYPQKPSLSVSSYSQDCFPEENFEVKVVSAQGKKGVNLFVYPLYIVHGKWYMVRSLSLELGIKQNQENHALAPLKPGSSHAIILCPDELGSSASALKKLQEGDGYLVKVVTLSEAKKFKPSDPPSLTGIYGFEDYPDSQKSLILGYDFDTALRIRTMLGSLLDENKIGYLTILGDATYIPPSYYVSIEDGLGEYEQWLPTDYFYMAPDAKGNTFDFDISVGRLPVRSPEDAVRVVDKISRYRRALQPSWFKNVALMGGDPFNRDYFGEQVLNDAVNHDYFKGMTIKRYFKTEGLYTTEGVLGGLKEASHGFLWAHGHGTGDGLALEPGRVDSKDIITLPKADKLPIIVSEACDSGAFDSRLVRPGYRTNIHFKDPTSFSEAVMLSEGAGIAYIGGVRTNFGGWIKEYERGVLTIRYLYYTDGMITHFFDQYSKGPSTLGDLVRSAMNQYINEDWYDYYTHAKTFFGFTFQGDPTLKLPYMASDGKRSTPAPVLSYQEEMPLTHDSIPLFSMNDGIHVTAKSDSPRLTYLVSDYLDHASPLRAKGEIKKVGLSVFGDYFVPDRKSTMTIRIQAEDGKETRIVYYSRYNVDLVVHQEDDLTLLKVNETKDYTFLLSNEGIKNAAQVSVSVTTPKETIKEYNIPQIAVLSSQRIYCTFTGAKEGDIELVMKANPLEMETITTDNISSYRIRVSDKPISRVGILQESEYNSREYYEKRLMIKKLNLQFRENNQSVELCVVPIARDENNQSSLTRLALNMIVLYTPYFYTKPQKDLLFYLEQFERQGGTVLGMMSLGYNQFGTPMNDLQEYFGIRRSESLYMLSKEDSQIQLMIQKEAGKIFSKDEYILNSRLFNSNGSSWRGIKLTHASLYALSIDEQIALTKSGQRYFYSGFLSDQDMDQGDDALLFLTELLSIPLQDRMDICLQSAYIDPLSTKNSEKPTLNVMYQNVGTLPAKELQLIVNHQEPFDLPPLTPGTKGTFSHKLEPKNFLATGEIHLEIVAGGKIKDLNTTNHITTFFYKPGEVVSSEKPVISLDGTLNRMVMTDTVTVSGSVTKGAALFIRDQPFAVNTDGTFSILLSVREGKQSFEMVAKQGEQKSDPVVLTINRQGSMMIQLVINDPIPYYNFEVGEKLDAAPFIYKSLTYVPLRVISETFGASVQYDNSSHQISIFYKTLSIHMIIGESRATIKYGSDSREILLQGPCIIVKGRSFVPIRFIAETFGASVDWNADLAMVSISRQIDLPDVEPPEMKYAVDVPKKEIVSQTIINGISDQKLINPSCMDVQEDGTLLVSAFDGIYQWNLSQEPKKIIDFKEWKTRFLKDGTFTQASMLPSRTLFRSWKKNIILTHQSKLYVIDPMSHKLLSTVSPTTYDTSPYPRKNYGTLCDLQIEGDFAYVLDLWEGFSVIDLLSGEVTQQYTLSNFPVSFQVKNSIVTSVGYFGVLIQQNLTTGELKTYKPISEIYPQSLFQNKGKFYLQTKQPSAIYEIIVKDKTISLGSGKKLSPRNNYYAEQLCFLPEYTLGLIVDPDTGRSCLSRLNASFGMIDDSFDEPTEWLSNHPSYANDIQHSYMVGDNQVLVSTGLKTPNPMLKLYSISGDFLLNIPIQLDSDQTEIKGLARNGDASIALLMRDKEDEKLMVQLIKFENIKKIQYKTVELRFDPTAFSLEYWTVDERFICFFDSMSYQVVVFDLSSGKEVQRIETKSSEYYPYYLSDQLILRYWNRQLFVFDCILGIMRVFDSKGKGIAHYYLGMIFKGNNPNISDIKIVSESQFALLDNNSAQVVVVENGAIKNIWSGFTAPLSLDIKDTWLLVNDGGDFQVTLRFIGEDQDKNPKLAVYPDAIKVLSTEPMEWTAQMSIQRWDDESPFEISAPPGVSFESLKTANQSNLISWKLSQSLPIGKSIVGSITIRSSKTRIEVPFSFTTVPPSVIINPLHLRIGSKIRYPKLPNKIEQGYLMIELSTLQEILPITCVDMKGELVINMPQDTLLIKTREGKAVLINQSGTKPFDLGAPVQAYKGMYWIPVNEILKHLSVDVTIQNFPVTWSIP
jgi:hypothetical protein